MSLFTAYLLWTLSLAFSLFFPPCHTPFMWMSCTSGQDIEFEDAVTAPYFPFSSSVAQAIGTFVVGTVYRARKANSLTDQFLKFNYSRKQKNSKQNNSNKKGNKSATATSHSIYTHSWKYLCKQPLAWSHSDFNGDWCKFSKLSLGSFV